MNGRDRNANRDCDMLMRIAALLFSLAGLAEQASRRWWFVRRRVLAILAPAEEAAYRCLADAARTFGVPVPVQAMVAAGEWMAAAGDEDSPDDALRLALRLRALAAALMLCLLSAGRFVLPDAASLRTERHEPTLRAGRPATAMPAPDTS